MKRSNARSQQTIVLPERQTSSLIVPPGGDDITTDGLEMDGQPEEDPVLQPPLWLFIVGGVEVLWGLITNFLQAGTSFTGLLGWQQQDTLTSYGLTEGTKLLVSRNMGFAVVALVLGVGAQIGIQVVNQQISRAWKQKRVVEHESTQQALVEVVSNLSIGHLLGGVSYLICAVSDYMFITEIDSSGSLGAYMIITFWAVILACSSTYVLLDGVQRIWSGVLAHRAWRLWQDSLRAHFEQLAQQYQA
jgi:hypothetical protein